MIHHLPNWTSCKFYHTHSLFISLEHLRSLQQNSNKVLSKHFHAQNYQPFISLFFICIKIFSYVNEISMFFFRSRSRLSFLVKSIKSLCHLGRTNKINRPWKQSHKRQKYKYTCAQIFHEFLGERLFSSIKYALWWHFCKRLLKKAISIRKPLIWIWFCW